MVQGQVDCQRNLSKSNIAFDSESYLKHVNGQYLIVALLGCSQLSASISMRNVHYDSDLREFELGLLFSPFQEFFALSTRDHPIQHVPSIFQAIETTIVYERCQ